MEHENDDVTSAADDGAYPVSEAVGLREFERFADAMDIDIDPAGMDDEDRKSLDVARRRFVLAVRDGSMVVSPDGFPHYTPKLGNTKTIKFNEPTGADLMSMDMKKRGHDMAKTYQVLASMTKEPVARFANMKRRDLRVCETVLTLFMG